MAWDEEPVAEQRQSRRLLAECNKLTFIEAPEAKRVRGELLGYVGIGVFLETLPLRILLQHPPDRRGVHEL